MCLKLVFDDPKYALVALGGSAFMAEKQMDVDIKKGKIRLWPLYESKGGPYIFSKDDIGFTTKIRNKDQIIEQELLCVDGFTSKSVHFSWSCKLGYHLSKYPIHFRLPSWQGFFELQKLSLVRVINRYEQGTNLSFDKFSISLPVIFRGDDFMLGDKENIVVERFTIANPEFFSIGINTLFKSILCLIFNQEKAAEKITLNIEWIPHEMTMIYKKFFKILEERLIVSDEE